MKVSELIIELASTVKERGDIECLVEIIGDDGTCHLFPVGEVSVEDRVGYGLSASILV